MKTGCNAPRSSLSANAGIHVPQPLDSGSGAGMTIRRDRLNARPCCMNGAATANRRLRFLGFARNDIGAPRMTSWTAGLQGFGVNRAWPNPERPGWWPTPPGSGLRRDPRSGSGMTGCGFCRGRGYLESVVLPRVRRRRAHPHPWIPAFAGKTDWRVQGFAGTTWNHSCERERDN